MTRSGRSACFTAAILATAWLAGCAPSSGISGTFDRTLTVNGPVRLELTNGSGDSRVSTGAPGEVRIHAEFRVRAWPWENAQRRRNEIESHPPVSQESNLIRVGGFDWRATNLTADYAILVPADTEIRAVVGSGKMDVAGIRGPASFVAGSGDIRASGIADDVRATVGSGDVDLTNVQGEVEATAGSGDVRVNGARGGVRLRAGSGRIRIEQPGGDVVAYTGSGEIEVTGATADLRLRTASGDITVDGNPGSADSWDIHAASGDVTLHVPSTASFRLYAHSSSGDISTAIPLTAEERSGRHELRARIGDGKARVEIGTASGTISVH